MNKCKRCGVKVADDTMVCPLCNTVLTEDLEEPLEEEASYPDVKEKTRRFRRIGRILLFLAFALEVLFVGINYATFSAIPTCWSAISGGILVYIIFTMWDVVKRRTGHIRKIYMQMFIVLALLLFIDAVLGFRKWSLEYGLPCVIFGVVVTIIICMSVNYTNWQNYLVMQLAVVLLSVVDLILFLTGVVHHLALTWIALGVSALLWIGTLIIGDRKAKMELKRKFHI